MTSVSADTSKADTAEVYDLFGSVSSETATGLDIHNDFIGRAGEFIVCAVLSEMGVFVHHVPSAGYDLIAEIDGELVRIQVKSRTYANCKSAYGFNASKELNKARNAGLKRQGRPLDKRDCDILACVAMDRRKVIFLPVSAIGSVRNVSVAISEFEIPNIELVSWTKVMQEIR